MNPLTANPTDNLTLYFREGTSDKIYQCSIEPAGDGQFSVTFAYGRRGTTLSTGVKTSEPVSYNDAKRIFDKLVREKMAKGYTPGADGTPYVGGNGDKQPSGYLPQLLNPIDKAEVQRLLRDNVHVAQEKFDGRRLLLRKEGAAIDGINRTHLLGWAEGVCQRLSEYEAMATFSRRKRESVREAYLGAATDELVAGMDSGIVRSGELQD